MSSCPGRTGPEYRPRRIVAEIGFEKQASRITMHIRFDQEGTGNIQRRHAHNRPFVRIGLSGTGRRTMPGVDDIRIVRVQLPQSIDQRLRGGRTVMGGVADGVVPHEPHDAGFRE